MKKDEPATPQPGTITPTKKAIAKGGAVTVLVDYVASLFPALGKKMREAGMKQTKYEFVSQQMVFAAVLTFLLCIITWVVIEIYGAERFLIIPAAIVLYPLVLLYRLQLPLALASKRRRELEKDVLFAGRHMWIALKGGMALFDSMLAISKGNYGEVSREMSRLTEKVLVGVPIDVAAAEVTEDNPSPTFRRLLMQIVNSVRSGADIADSLSIVLDQIAREQLISVREYGQKLNPTVMFYMVLGIIAPSLGISVGLFIISFAKLTITMDSLWAMIPVIALLQWMFLSYIEMTRPSYEM